MEEEGIEQQEAHCRVVAEAVHNWEVVEVYRDNKTSASKDRDDSTDWARMLRDFDQGRFSVIVCVSVDRLLRRVVDVVELRAPRRNRDARIVTARDGIDTGTPLGNTILTILVALAEAEIETKKARMVPFADARREVGHPSPGLVPHGYRWIPKSERDERGTRFEIVEHEAEDVRFMFKEALAVRDDKPEEFLAGICRELNIAGSRTRRGAPWRSSTVRRLLLSPFVAGLLPERMPTDTGGNRVPYKAELVNLDKCRKGAWEAIVSEDQLRAARRVLLQPSRRKHDGNTSRKWLLAGLARCARCGGLVRSARTKERYRAYRCLDGHFQRQAEIIDRYVEQAVLDRLAYADAFNLITPSPQVDVPALNARRQALESRRSELLDLVQTGDFTASEVRSRVTPIDAELDQVRVELAAALSVDPLSEMTNSEDLRATWEGLSLARRRRVISALVVIDVHPVGKGVRVRTLEQAAHSITLTWWGRHPMKGTADGRMIRSQTPPKLEPWTADEVAGAIN